MHPIVPYAKTAYAQGWAASGGPMTDAVKAGCLAAIDYAVQHADSPDVLEVTLHLGHLEGVWAAIYERRLKLHDRTEQAAIEAWRPIVRDLPVADMISELRQRFGLTEDTYSLLKYFLKTLAQRMLAWIRRHDAFPNFRQAIRDAIAAAQAEGRTDALALGADKLGLIGFDFAIAFEHAYAALGDSARLWAEADGWIQRITDAAATDVADKLAALTRAGASYEEMVTAISDLLGSGNLRAIRTMIDLMTSRALSQGALDLYASEGVRQVSYITAGDGRVCPRCEDAESKSPYPLLNTPTPGLHPNCRCVLAAVTPLPASTLKPYLPEG